MNEREQRSNPAGVAWDMGQGASLAVRLLGVKGVLVLLLVAAVVIALGSVLAFLGFTVAQAAALLGPRGLSVPPQQLQVMLAVEKEYGVPWQVLAAIAYVESSFGQNMGPSPAGAIGYCQFMPDTWAVYGRDEDGDGQADPMSYRDCLPAVARFLLAHGWRNDDVNAQRQALYAYNHDWVYVDRTRLIAMSFGLGGLYVGGLQWPVPGHYGISSFYGQVDEARGPAPHTGIDIPAPEGTPVVAAAGGIVHWAGADAVCGSGVTISHGSDMATAYCHLSAVLVGPGQTVQAGQVIGLVGNTGQSTGPHLHFGVIAGGRTVDPLRFLEG